MKAIKAILSMSIITIGLSVSLPTLEADASSNKIEVSSEKSTPAKTSKKVQTKTSVKTNFKNCTELRKVYPKGVKKGHPAYLKKHDRDKDNWACEVETKIKAKKK